MSDVKETKSLQSRSLKKPGWFSRRNKTSEAHEKAKAAKEAAWLAQLKASVTRELAAKERTPEEQIERLDRMFGKGKGAKKERAKLAARIQAREEAEQDEKKAQQQKPKKKKKKGKSKKGKKG